MLTVTRRCLQNTSPLVLRTTRERSSSLHSFVALISTETTTFRSNPPPPRDFNPQPKDGQSLSSYSTKFRGDSIIPPQYKVSFAKLLARKQNPKPLEMPKVATPKSLSHSMGIRTVEVLKALILKGHRPQSSEDVMTPELADEIVSLFYFIPQRSHVGFDKIRRRDLSAVKEKKLVHRQPTVTIMGHVDHGKTTLLDTLRSSHVAEKEAGGITQKVSAFQVPSSFDPTRKVTFIDTPGHAAFSSMRQRGSQFTDMVVLIVAVDDGVQPQTIEAIKLIQEAKCAMIVALNKIDKGDANVQRIKSQLVDNGVALEGFGGDVPAVEISAKQGTNLDLLMEAILLRAEELELKTELTGKAEGFLLESHLDPHRGPIVCSVIRIGTLNVGDHIVAGSTYGRVKNMQDEHGNAVKNATPGSVVYISGFREVPDPGVELVVVDNEKIAKEGAEFALKQKQTEQQQQSALEKAVLGSTAESATTSEPSPTKKGGETRAEEEETNEEEEEEAKPDGEYLEGVRIVRTPRGRVFDVPDNLIYTLPTPKTLNIVAKVDSSGSLDAFKKLIDALVDSIKTQVVGGELLDIRLISTGIGQLNESEVTMASDANAFVACFNTRPTPRAKSKAKSLEVNVATSNIIFDLLDRIVAKAAALLPPKLDLEVKGSAEVVMTFPITMGKGSKKTPVAGCKITEGMISTNQRARLVRRDTVIYQGHLHSLRHFKKDVTDLKSGNECGIALEGWDDYQPGDLIQSYVMKATPQKINLGQQFSRSVGRMEDRK